MSKINKLKTRFFISLTVYLLKTILPLIFPQLKSSKVFAEVLDSLVVPLFDIVTVATTDMDDVVEVGCNKYDNLLGV